MASRVLPSSSSRERSGKPHGEAGRDAGQIGEAGAGEPIAEASSRKAGPMRPTREAEGRRSEGGRRAARLGGQRRDTEGWREDGVPVIIKHRRTNSGTNSESCGSSAFSASTSMDLEHKIFLYLFNIKFQTSSSEWRASDDWVLDTVHDWIQSRGFNMNMDQIKQHINEFEERVKRHKEQTAEIVQDKDKNVMLELFDYITPDYVRETPPENVGAGTQVIPTSNIKRVSPENVRTPTEIYPTSSIKRVKMTSYPAITSHLNGSIGEQLSRLLEEREVVQDILTGPISMCCCIEKLEKLGFAGPEFYVAIDMLKADIEVRQILTMLEDSKAKDYVFHLLKKPIS